MKLNDKCMGDIMLYIEENLKFINSVVGKDAPANIFIMETVRYVSCLEEMLAKGYSLNDIRYSLLKLKELGFIHCYETKNDITEDGIEDVTVKGHIFLSKLKSGCASILE